MKHYWFTMLSPFKKGLLIEHHLLSFSQRTGHQEADGLLAKKLQELDMFCVTEVSLKIAQND